MPDLPASALAAIPSLPSLKPDRVVGTPTEIYTRIARGAVTCWFGASGPLKAAYVYHAEAQPESKGGAAEITIFSRDTSTGPDPRALKAFEVQIKPTAGTPELSVQNYRMEAVLANRLQSDVARWAADEEGCISGVTDGWTANEPKPGQAGKRAAKK